MGHLQHWIKIWYVNPGIHNQVALGWPVMREKLLHTDPNARWAKCRGPLEGGSSAPCCSRGGTRPRLLQQGWDPATPTEWGDPEGGQWALGQELCNMDEFEEAFRSLTWPKLWGRASSHHLGAGLGGGCLLQPLYKHIKRLEKQGNLAGGGQAWLGP